MTLLSVETRPHSPSVDDVERLLTSAAADLNARGLASEIEVLVDSRRRDPFRLQGLCAYNPWTDVFEPVRRRWPWHGRWTSVQPARMLLRRSRGFSRIVPTCRQTNVLSGSNAGKVRRAGPFFAVEIRRSAPTGWKSCRYMMSRAACRRGHPRASILRG